MLLTSGVEDSTPSIDSQSLTQSRLLPGLMMAHLILFWSSPVNLSLRWLLPFEVASQFSNPMLEVAQINVGLPCSSLVPLILRWLLHLVLRILLLGLPLTPSLLTKPCRLSRLMLVHLFLSWFDPVFLPLRWFYPLVSRLVPLPLTSSLLTEPWVLHFLWWLSRSPGWWEHPAYSPSYQHATLSAASLACCVYY